MIARIWHGITPISKADEYIGHQNKSGIADYQATEGNHGVYFLRRIEGEQVHFLVVSFRVQLSQSRSLQVKITRKRVTILMM